MAIDQVNKRRNIASNAIARIGAYKDAVRALQELKDEYATAGAFADADFSSTDLRHVDAGMINGLFGGGGNVDVMTTSFDGLKAALLKFLP